MKSIGENLGQVVTGGPSVWTTRKSRDLADALQRSGSDAAAHLREFCTSVEEWLNRRDDDGNRIDFDKKYEWLKSVANPFLGGLTRARLDEIVSQVSSLPDRIGLLGILLHRPTQTQLIPATLSTGEQLARQAPRESPPSREAANPWIVRARLLVTTAGLAVPSQLEAAALARLLSPLPPWLLTELFRSTGQLDLFENYSLDLALALPLLDLNLSAPAFVEAWRATQHTRLAEMLRLLARFLSGPPHGIPRYRLREDLPTRDQISEFLTAIRTGLNAVDQEQARRLWNWIEAAHEYEVEISNLFAAYLGARPQNHEVIIDYLSAHQDPSFPSVSHWKLPSVTFTTRSSMRTNSLHVATSDKRTLEPPDFDPTIALRRLPLEAAVHMVLTQPSPEFALEYLQRLQRAQNPAYDMIVGEVFTSPGFLTLLRSATGSMAASVLAHIEPLRSSGDTPRALGVDLLRILLPRVPSEYLSNDGIVWLATRSRQLFFLLREVVRRLKRAQTIGEINTLLRSPWLPASTAARILQRIDIGPLLPPAAGSNDEFEAWATSMVHLYSDAPELARRITDALPLDAIALLFRSYEYFGVTEHESSTYFMAKRLSFKALLLGRWTSLGATGAAECLISNANRDFTLWLYTDLRPPDPLVGPRQAPAAADDWLDAVTRIDATLLDAYLEGLLRLSKFIRDPRRAGPDLEQALAYASWWLEQRGLAAGERLWEALTNRIDRALTRETETEEEAADEIATIGLAALPGPPERIRALREHAVRALRKRYRTRAAMPVSRTLQRFIALLRQAAPDLHDELSSDPSTEMPSS